jgi:hypothetical protein
MKAAATAAAQVLQKLESERTSHRQSKELCMKEEQRFELRAMPPL